MTRSRDARDGGDAARSMRSRRRRRGWSGWPGGGSGLSRDGELAAEEVRHRSRTFSVAIDADGMYVVRGRLEPEVGAVLMRAIEAASDALYRGEDGDARPRNRQRRADAAGLVAERALAGGFGKWCGGRAWRRRRRLRPWRGEWQPCGALPGRGPHGRRDADGARRDGTLRARRGAGQRGDIAAHGVRRRAGRDVSPGRRSGERGAADGAPSPRTSAARWRNGTAAAAIRGVRAASPRRTTSSTGPMGARPVWPTRCCSAGATIAWSTRAGRGWRWTVTARPRSSRARVR